MDIKEKEKEVLMQNLSLGQAQQYQGSLLEKQASDIVNMQQAIAEYERRFNLGEKKWGELLRENM